MIITLTTGLSAASGESKSYHSYGADEGGKMKVKRGVASREKKNEKIIKRMTETKRK